MKNSLCGNKTYSFIGDINIMKYNILYLLDQQFICNSEKNTVTNRLFESDNTLYQATQKVLRNKVFMYERLCSYSLI